ncbi:MAG: CvpA family protein [Hyphomicrobiales bacterium]|nr:CvpA family protein [Hyphomicrobiales bacterium]
MPVDFNALTFFDFLVLVIVGFSAFLALVRGFLHEMVAILGFVIAVYGTSVLAPITLPVIQTYVPTEPLARAISLVGVFLLLLMATSVFAQRLMLILHQNRISLLDHTLGFAFGAARGFLFMIVAWLALTLILPGQAWPIWIEDAEFLPYIRYGALQLLQLLPSNLAPQEAEAFLAAPPSCAIDPCVVSPWL